MKNWSKEFKNYVLGLISYTVLSILVFIGMYYFFPSLQFSILESFAVVMAFVIIWSGWNVWNETT
jgi:hypothetical protein